MAVAGKRVTATTTAAKLNTATTDSVSGSTLLVRNKDASVSVYLGGSDVTSATGFELAFGESAAIDLSPGDDVYARTASGTVVCHILEGGL